MPPRYPPIADYALLSDCHSMALVSRHGSIDWCCMPRLDSSSCFGRLLDWDRGGFFAIEPIGRHRTHRAYVGRTMVLATTVITAGGEAQIFDTFSMREGGREEPLRELIRVIVGVRGRVDLNVQIRARFDYGEVKPWLRYRSLKCFAAVGGDDGLLFSGDLDFEISGGHDLRATCSVRPEERIRIATTFVRPHRMDGFEPPSPPETIDERLRGTIEWWERWSAAASMEGADGPAAVRSAIVLKALTYAPTGAIAAAATTSLPEQIGGPRNWDYRFSWIRDSSFSARALTDVGFDREADRFRQFIQRASAGSAADLQIMYGVGGERRLTEIELPLDGYRQSRPVRIGNGAARQFQLDAYGELVDLSWRWHQRGHSPDDDYWRFLLDLVDTACERWSEPDRGIWEIRGRPQHFVHSKVLCWVAVDRGLRLAQECMRVAPVRRWRRVAKEIREAVETLGYDARRGVFRQAFRRRNVDASLLLLPSFGFVDALDERMVRTVEAIRADLDDGGLILRYRVDRTDDGLPGTEGVFLACTFWMAQVLAGQGRLAEARSYFDRAAATANDLGLFAEEYESRSQRMLGNFPQGLTHLSHISAAVAMRQAQEAMNPDANQ